jgi:nucleotide-binding universal stress UspA family protein
MDVDDITDEFGRTVLSHARREYQPRKPVEPSMHLGRVLLATDGSEASAPALEWAALLTKTFGGELHAATVLRNTPELDFYGGAAASILEAERAAAQDILDEAMTTLGDRGLKPTAHLLQGGAATQIVRLATKYKIDVIVVGSHGRTGIKRLLLGSVAEAVKNHADANVLIARIPPPPRHVLIPADGSATSGVASQLGLRIAMSLKKPATMLHAVAGVEFATLKGIYEDFMREASNLTIPDWKELGIRADVQFGNPSQVILDQARAVGADLIVIGSRGMGGLKAARVGSVSNRIAHEADASVLLVRGDT